MSREPLPKKKIQYSEWHAKQTNNIKKWERVLFFNPSKIYKRLGDKIDPFKRHAGLSMEQVFPKIEGKCSCGCKRPPESGNGWQRKWAGIECQAVAGDILSILNNYFGKPAFYIKLYSGYKCSECESTCDLELDHIVGVKQGGGGCWLSNYRWLCRVCHVEKTNKDFGRTAKKANPMHNYKLEL